MPGHYACFGSARLVPEFQAEVGALNEQVRRVPGKSGAGGTNKWPGGGGWELVGVDHRIDNIPGPNHIGPIKEAVPEGEPPPLAELVSDLEVQLGNYRDF